MIIIGIVKMHSKHQWGYYCVAVEHKRDFGDNRFCKSMARLRRSTRGVLVIAVSKIEDSNSSSFTGNGDIKKFKSDPDEFLRLISMFVMVEEKKIFENFCHDR
jgi:hypothetical protein